MALKSDENITARELLELQKQGFISSSKLLEELKKSKRKEGSSVLQQALASAPKAQMADPSAVDVGTVPKVRTPEAGPTSRRGLDKIYMPKAAEGMVRDRNMYDMEPDPIIGQPDQMLAKGAYMKQVNEERQAEKNMADMANTRKQQLANIAKDDSFAKTGKSISYNQFLEDNVSGDLKAKKPSGLMEEVLMSDTSPKLMEESVISGDDPTTMLTEDIVQTSGQAAQADIDAELERIADTSYLEEMPMGRGTPAYRSIEEETIEADPPEVAEMKKVQEDPKARAELFKDLPPAIKAQAKEEFGDYYIDPSTGYAINLKSLRKSQKRREHMDVIKHFPESLRPAMLHKWGYLDGEDVPVDERLQLDKQKLGFEMTKYFAGLNENKRQFNATFGEGKRQFEATLGNKKYEFGESMSFKKTQQALLDKQFGENVRQFDANLAETQKKNVISGIGEFLKNGQFEAATFYAKSNGLELPFSIKDALRFQSAKKAKSASGDPVTSMLASTYGVKMSDYWKSSDSTVEKLMSPREDAGSGDSYFDAGMRLINMVPYKELPEDQRGQISEADYNARNFIAVKNFYMNQKYPRFHQAYSEQQMLNEARRRQAQKGEDTPEQTNTSTIPSRADDIDEDDLDTSTMSETQSSVVQPSNQTQRRMTGLSEASTGQGFQVLKDLIDKGKRGREQMRR